MDFIEEAVKMCRSSGRASESDVPLLVKVLGKLPTKAVVVQLGAGSIFTVTILGAKPEAIFYSVDLEINSFGWEDLALKNCGHPDFKKASILSTTIDAARDYKGPKVDLLIVDSDHTYEAVLGDLKAWAPHMKSTHYIFMHDYEAQGRGAPFVFPGVKKACDEFFKTEYTLRDGWSAVWGIGVVPKPRKKRKAK